MVNEKENNKKDFSPESVEEENESKVKKDIILDIIEYLLLLFAIAFILSILVAIFFNDAEFFLVT
ncbi:MAG: hypothetical protein EU548_00700, partial [Promethearchaeota archaeon]